MNSWERIRALLLLICVFKNTTSQSQSAPLVCSDGSVMFYLNVVGGFKKFGLGDDVPKTSDQPQKITTALCAKFQSEAACNKSNLFREIYEYALHLFKCTLQGKAPYSYKYAIRQLDRAVKCHIKYCRVGKQFVAFENKVRWETAGVKGNCFLHLDLMPCYNPNYWAIIRTDVNITNCQSHDQMNKCVRKEIEREQCSYHFLNIALNLFSDLVNGITKRSRADCPPKEIEHFTLNRRKEKSANSRIKCWSYNDLWVVILGLYAAIYNFHA